ncbi:MAG: response regulator receiver [Comamonadaceae bacterium]|nr:MAG: response regulator receiver [Comamonadaceae bacterium]
MDDSKLLQASILIVDDLEFNINLLERVLAKAGYTSVSSTTNPREVSALHRKNHYDLILLDIEMPDMDGFQVMRRMKETHGDDQPPILVITAEPEHRMQALQCGAKDFVSKPFELVEVLTRVHNMLEARLLQKEIDDHKDDNPALSHVIQRNIRKIIQIRQKASQDQNFQDRIANVMTSFSGSMTFFYVHMLWFLLWFLLNTGHLGVTVFDPYPYGFLTMVVSLEAIFLATFVLISQNLLARGAERLTDLGLQTSLLTEHELTRVLQMLRTIQIKIGIANDESSNLADADLEMETKPEDVLAEIERLHRREAISPRRGRQM